MNKKLMILTVVTVMVVLISLGGSQVLSGGPGFKANYYADFYGQIQGGGPVEWSRGRFISSGGYTYTLEFSEEEEEGFWVGYYENEKKDFIGQHEYGWLLMTVGHPASFMYRWSDEEGNYDLSGHGWFIPNKKEKTFIFTSDGTYRLVQWFQPPDYEPSKELWTGDPQFEIYGEYLER